MQSIAEPLEIAGDYGPVEAEFRTDVGNGLWRSGLAEIGRREITRQGFHAAIDQHGYGDQQAETEEEALQDQRNQRISFAEFE